MSLSRDADPSPSSSEVGDADTTRTVGFVNRPAGICGACDAIRVARELSGVSCEVEGEGVVFVGKREGVLAGARMGLGGGRVLW